MSNSITNLMTAIKTNGIQPVNMYSCTIFDIDGGSIDFDTHLIDLTLPGPKYQYYTNSFWRGNPEWKQPVGVKYEDPLLMVLIVPSQEKNVSNNLFSFLQTNRSKFSYPGNGGGSFIWKGPLTSNYEGYRIHVYPINQKGQKQSPYIYRNCFVEKILPFKFSTEAEPAYQTMTLQWAVGGESSRL